VIIENKVIHKETVCDISILLKSYRKLIQNMELYFRKLKTLFHKINKLNEVFNILYTWNLLQKYILDTQKCVLSINNKINDTRLQSANLEAERYIYIHFLFCNDI
jgi:hypothetical protein